MTENIHELIAVRRCGSATGVARDDHGKRVRIDRALHSRDDA